jgi:hypothetical protein
MWAEALPPFIVENIATFGLLVVGFLVEKQYVSRPATFANALALNSHTYQQPASPDWLIWYANIGLAIGAIAILSYEAEESLPDSFYQFTMLLYSSIPVALAIFVTL